jgi:hypothetical protein
MKMARAAIRSGPCCRIESSRLRPCAGDGNIDMLGPEPPIKRYYCCEAAFPKAAIRWYSSEAGRAAGSNIMPENGGGAKLRV